jgi:hypothetical protein
MRDSFGPFALSTRVEIARSSLSKRNLPITVFYCRLVGYTVGRE